MWVLVNKQSLAGLLLLLMNLLQTTSVVRRYSSTQKTGVARIRIVALCYASRLMVVEKAVSDMDLHSSWVMDLWRGMCYTYKIDGFE